MQIGNVGEATENAAVECDAAIASAAIADDYGRRVCLMSRVWELLALIPSGAVKRGLLLRALSVGKGG